MLAKFFVVIFLLQSSIDVLGDVVRCNCGNLRENFNNFVRETNARMQNLEDEIIAGHGNMAPIYKSRACRSNTYRGQGYYVSDVPNLDYSTASNYCKAIGGHLPYHNMKTIADRKHVMQMMGINLKFFWIGLTNQHNVWRWEDGSVANKNTVGFAKGEPSGRGESSTPENCVNSWLPDRNVLAHLNDLRCNWALQSMAKYVQKNFKWTLYGSVALCEFDCTHSN